MHQRDPSSGSWLLVALWYEERLGGLEGEIGRYGELEKELCCSWVRKRGRGLSRSFFTDFGLCLLAWCLSGSRFCMRSPGPKNSINSRRSIPFPEELCFALALRGVDGFQGGLDDFLVVLSGGTDW